MTKTICLITGCNSGIGKATAIELARQNYEVLMLVRDSEKSKAACDDIKRLSGSESVKLFHADLSSFKSIISAADQIKEKYTHIDVLINNAGLLKRKFEKTADGFETTLAVNYFAAFLLTNLLLPLLRKSAKARIINVGSALYKKGKVNIDNHFLDIKFSGDKAYQNSKLLLLYFTKELAKRLEDTNITVNYLHPGVIGTDVFREYPKWINSLLNLFISNPTEGAVPEIYLTTSAEVKNISGKYFYKKKQRDTATVANDENLSRQIWEKTEEITRAL